MNLVSSLRRPVPAVLPVAAAPSASRRAWGWTLGWLAGAWLLVWNQQRLEWSVNPTYAYGWAVPLLAGWLLFERWRSRPVRETPPPPWPWLLVPAGLLLAYLPVRVVQEPNPDWVKINWIMAGLVAGLSLCAVFSVAGGRGAWHCAFPILFCLTALPWPVWVEDNLTKSLMHWNAAAAAEVLTLAGHPALAKGNLIQIGSSWLNVEEACSGIRSLQTAFMVSLFFGEFHRLGWLGRIGLLLASFAVAFALNFARTVTLTWLGGVGGPAATERWHDAVGTVAMVACLGALWLLAEIFVRRKRPAPGGSGPPVATRPSRAPFPVWFAVLGLGWLGVSEAATAGWYAWHERGMPAPLAWDVRWPTSAPGFHEEPLGERSQALLKYNEGHLASWRTAEGYRWQMYYLRWQPGRVSKFLAGGHYPTVCLPAGGLRLVGETGPVVCTVDGVSIPFVSYLFEDNGRDVYVFHAIVEEAPGAYADRIVYRQANSSERIASVLRGERNLGQRVLGIALTGPLDEAEARASLQATLADLILTAPAPARVASVPAGPDLQP